MRTGLLTTNGRDLLQGATGLRIGEAVLSETGDDASQISESDKVDEVLGRDIVSPNLNGGSCASGCGFCGTAVMLRHFVLVKDGLIGFDFLLSCGNCSAIDSCTTGLDDRGARQSENRASVGVPSGVGDCKPKPKAAREGL